MRRFFALVALAATLIFPMASHAGFSVKLFSDPVDTGSDVTFGSMFLEFDSEYVGFLSDADIGSPVEWPLAGVRFGAEVTGYLYVGTAGEYPLYLGSDDGAYLFVNGALAIARPGDQAFSETVQSVALGEGYNPFRIAYYNGPCCGTGLTLSADDRVTITPVPEPASYALMIAGLMLVGAAARSRQLRRAA